MGVEQFVPHILALVILLLLASISAIVFKRLKFPFTIGLVVIGIVFAGLIDGFQSLNFLKDIQLSHDIILYIILPTLIFDAAVNIDSRMLVKNIMPVLALAVPGLIISTFIIGFAVARFTPLHLGVAMLFGALISATDPVAVIALFNEIGAPKRLTLLVDGESLFNDATAIVAFTIVMAMIMSGASMSMGTLSAAAIKFLYVFVGGLVFGVILGFFMTKLINLSRNEPLIQIALSMVAAYSSFILADYYLGVSGVMSTLGAGIVLSWYGSIRFTAEAKEYFKQFWEYAAFVANSFIFLLLGITEWKLFIKHGHTKNLATYLIYTIIIVTLARVVVVYGIIPLLKFFPKYEKINLKYQTVIFWGGLRGAVPLALVLSLKSNFESRQLITEFTLGVVLFTLLVQGTTTNSLIKIFKLGTVTLFEKIMCLQTKLESIRKGGELVKSLEGQKYLSKTAVGNMKKSYEKIAEKTKKELIELQKDPEFKDDTVRKLLWYQAISVELKSYQLLFDKELISESVIRELELNIEFVRDRLTEGIFPSIQITAVPLEVRFKHLFVNLSRLVLPRAEFIKLLRFRTLSTKYEMALAMISANNHIKSVIGRMPQLYGAQRAITEECQDFYKKRADLAMIQRRKLEKYISVDKLQRKTLYRAAINAELETIEELSSNGGIPESVANILKSDINEKIALIAKQNPTLSQADLKN